MSIPDSPEVRKKRIETWAKVIGAGAICLIVSPIIFSVVQGMIGLIVAGAVGFTAVQMMPYFAMKVANWRMKLIMHEAGKNPIETMRNVFIDNTRIIQEKDRKIVEFEGRVGDYHDKMTDFAKRYPEESPKFQIVEGKMRQALTIMKRKQTEAKRLQADYKAKIDKAEAIYAMALAAQEVTELAGDAAADVYRDIKNQVAFDSVNHTFNTAVASLSMEVDTASTTDYKALPEDTGATQVPAEIVEFDKVRRRA